MLWGEGSEDAADERGVEGCGSGFAADVSDGEGGAAGTVVEVVVDIASDGTGGDELGGDFGALELGWTRWHEAKLDLAGHLEVALHALLFLVDALVEARVGDADGDLRGQSGEGALVVVVVVVDAGVFEVEDADDLAFIDEGNGELGADFGVGFDVAGVFADVGSENRFAELGGGADKAFAKSDDSFADDALAEAGGEAVLEVLIAVVPEKDAEDLAGDVVEDAEGLGLAGDAGVEAGVFYGDGHAGGDELKEALVFKGEVADGFGLEVENADDLVFDDKRDREFGADVGVGVDVVVGFGD